MNVVSDLWHNFSIISTKCFSVTVKSNCSQHLKVHQVICHMGNFLAIVSDFCIVTTGKFLNGIFLLQSEHLKSPSVHSNALHVIDSCWKNGCVTVLKNTRMQTCFPARYRWSHQQWHAKIDYCPGPLILKLAWVNECRRCGTRAPTVARHSQILSIHHCRRSTQTWLLHKKKEKKRKTQINSLVLTSCGKHVGMATLPARLLLWSPPDTRHTSAVWRTEGREAGARINGMVLH